MTLLLVSLAAVVMLTACACTTVLAATIDKQTARVIQQLRGMQSREALALYAGQSGPFAGSLGARSQAVCSPIRTRSGSRRPVSALPSRSIPVRAGEPGCQRALGTTEHPKGAEKIAMKKEIPSDLACRLGGAGFAVLSYVLCIVVLFVLFILWMGLPIPDWMWWPCLIASPVLTYLTLRDLYHWFWGHCQQYRHRKVDLP